MKIKKTKGERIFNVVNIVLLTILTICFIIPFWTTIVSSFISVEERLSRSMFILWPEKFDFTAYATVLKKGSNIYRGYLITIGRTVIGTFTSMVVTIMLAFGISKKNLPYRKPITFLLYFTMLFNGGLIPTFLIVKYTGLYNTFGAYIVPSMVSVWNLFLLRNFFMDIPDSFEEAALIDGATPGKYLVKILVPLSLPSITTISLFYAVSQWNSWFDALIYVSNTNMLPLQSILRNIIVNASSESALNTATTATPSESLKGATIVVSTLPIICVYPFIQKYFVKGVMVGGVKG